MVHHNSCPLCSSAAINLKIVCNDHFKSNESFPVWACSVCGFCFTQDHPDETAIGKYYESEDYISHSDTSKGLVNKIYRMVRKRMLRKKRSIVINETGLKQGTILDIGSGTGHFAAAMKDAGWMARGIEINKKPAMHLLKILDSISYHLRIYLPLNQIVLTQLRFGMSLSISMICMAIFRKSAAY